MYKKNIRQGFDRILSVFHHRIAICTCLYFIILYKTSDNEITIMETTEIPVKTTLYIIQLENQIRVKFCLCEVFITIAVVVTLADWVYNIIWIYGSCKELSWEVSIFLK